MVIGVLQISLSLEGMHSLKDKRHIVKSIIDRLKSRFNASVAETGMNDSLTSAVIGAVCLTGESSHADSMMAAIVNFVENDGRAVLEDYSTEIVHM